MDNLPNSETHKPVVTATGTAVDGGNGNHHKITTNADRDPLLSWGSILAGLFVLIAISWLLYLLGIALGVSIVDATAGDAIGAGLGIGAVIWLLVSSLIAYFLGSLMAARLCGKTDCTVGMLHGLTLWGLATTMLVIFSYMGVTSLLQTGAGLVSSTVSNVASATSSTVAHAGQAIESIADTELADNIQARLKRRATAVISQAAAEGSDGVRTEQVRDAIDTMDSQTMQQIASHVAMGELRAAREKFAAQTNLSSQEVREIIDNISSRFEEQLKAEENPTGLVGDVTNALKREVSEYVASLNADGRADVSSNEISTAMSQLTPPTMQKIAWRLAQGKTQSAKDLLTANTDLTSPQINSIVDGVEEDVSSTVQHYQDQASQAVEVASTYAKAVLWSVFLAGAMGLAISLLGGWIGTESTRTIEMHGSQGFVSRLRAKRSPTM